MKILPPVSPTPEQLPIIAHPQTGITLIRGSAGSGKTTTALLMLRQLAKFWREHFKRSGEGRKPKILVLTYNRTLRGYIKKLAETQLKNQDEVELTVSTFGKWSMNQTGIDSLLDNSQRRSKLNQLGNALPLKTAFMLDEIEYCTGRFMPNQLDDYLIAKRVGRGISPRMELTMREKLVSEVINPYGKWKTENHLRDWNDLAINLINAETGKRAYDVIIADEAQDFSANQLRALHHYAADQSSVILVLDAAQRIYPRGHTWAEAGLSIDRTHRLNENHRNTKQICALASPLLDGIDIGDDGTIPNLSNCNRSGALPILLEGKFSLQASWALDKISYEIDLTKESVAFLHPKGYGYFDYLREQLLARKLQFVELSVQSEWPECSSNIALSTMHSAKGLEFDHLFLLGLNTDVLEHGEYSGDTQEESWRRTIAMAITRARNTVTLGTKPEEKSDLLSHLDPKTFELTKV